MSDRIAVFNDGRIEQIGRPAEVYEHPATEFVAGFVGTSNVIMTGDGPLRYSSARRRSRLSTGSGARRTRRRRGAT